MEGRQNFTEKNIDKKECNTNTDKINNNSLEYNLAKFSKDIFKTQLIPFLKVKDLSNVMQVSKLWADLSKESMKKLHKEYLATFERGNFRPRNISEKICKDLSNKIRSFLKKNKFNIKKQFSAFFSSKDPLHKQVYYLLQQVNVEYSNASPLYYALMLCIQLLRDEAEKNKNTHLLASINNSFTQYELRLAAAFAQYFACTYAALQKNHQSKAVLDILEVNYKKDEENALCFQELINYKEYVEELDLIDRNNPEKLKVVKIKFLGYLLIDLGLNQSIIKDELVKSTYNGQPIFADANEVETLCKKTFEKYAEGSFGEEKTSTTTLKRP